MTVPAVPANDPARRTVIVQQISALRRNYAPRPTPWDALDQVEQLAMTQQWIDTLLAFDSPTVIDAVTDWIDQHNAWFPSLNDVVNLCHTVTRRRAAARQNARRARGHCDGSGWVHDPEIGGVPCTRCNPFLHDLFGSDDWVRWRQGSPLQNLVPEIKQVHGTLTTPDERPMPPPCQIIPDPNDPFLPPVTGVEVAWAGYQDQAVEDGAVADRDRFMRTMRTML